MRLRLLVVAALVLAAGTAKAMPAGCQSSSSRHESVSAVPAVPGGCVVFIGASVSDGHGLGGEVCLSRTFEASLAVPGYACENFSTGKFMDLTSQEREALVQAALVKEPDLVVAVDFLFWFAHFVALGDEGRLQKFEAGLELLSRFTCPMVVGDLPDVREATKEFPLLGFALPSRPFLERANGRLREWVRERNLTKPTLLIPLADAVAAQMAGTPLLIGVREFETGKLLQRDRLHPSAEGHQVLCVLLQQTLIDGKLFHHGHFK
jgi:hypothetical protein